MAAQVTSAAALWSPARFRCSCRLLAPRKPMGTRGSGIGMRALQTIVAGEKLRGKQSQVNLAENFSRKPGGTAKNGRRSLMVVRMAMREESSLREVYQGIYGPWSVEDVDVREVILYRGGLVTAASAFLIAASTVCLSDEFPLKAALQSSYDIFYAVGAGGLGVALLLIHIYVTPIKRTLQLFWALGVAGSLGVALALARPADQGLVTYVLEHPTAIWAVGPLFASLTGLVFKEGLCYGKLEAGALVFVIPTLLLGRLSGVMDEKVQFGLLLTWMALFSLFASRKFTQPIKDDIGDKSVFMFNALPEESKQAVIARIQEQSGKEKVE
ncbi:unnamed protein product [Sphagnum troendelagicum]